MFDSFCLECDCEFPAMVRPSPNTKQRLRLSKNPAPLELIDWNKMWLLKLACRKKESVLIVLTQVRFWSFTLFRTIATPVLKWVLMLKYSGLSEIQMVSWSWRSRPQAPSEACSSTIWTVPASRRHRVKDFGPWVWITGHSAWLASGCLTTEEEVTHNSRDKFILLKVSSAEDLFLF